jgi:hypothetical protein
VVWDSYIGAGEASVRSILILALLVATPAVADSTTDRVVEAITTDVCAVRGRNAAKIMEFRQDGFPMSKLIAAFRDLPSGKQMVRDAYSTPRYSTSRHRLRAIEDFRNVAELECYKAGLDEGLVPTE